MPDVVSFFNRPLALYQRILNISIMQAPVNVLYGIIIKTPLVQQALAVINEAERPTLLKIINVFCF
jgi:hypothetical protein